MRLAEASYWLSLGVEAGMGTQEPVTRIGSGSLIAFWWLGHGDLTMKNKELASADDDIQAMALTGLLLK